MDLQSDQTDCFGEFPFTLWFTFLQRFIESCQLAALKLVERGKIAFDTPVSDYLPQFRNPIIVERTTNTREKNNFRPAETVMTLRHLLTMTSGLFYPTEPGLPKGYSSKKIHHSEDPISEFFRVIIVRFNFLVNL